MQINEKQLDALLNVGAVKDVTIKGTPLGFSVHVSTGNEDATLLTSRGDVRYWGQLNRLVHWAHAKRRLPRVAKIDYADWDSAVAAEVHSKSGNRPNSTTRRTLADSDAGRNLTKHADAGAMFAHLDAAVKHAGN